MLIQKKNLFYKNIAYKLYCSLLNPDLFDKNNSEILDFLNIIIKEKDFFEIINKSILIQFLKFNSVFENQKTKEQYRNLLKKFGNSEINDIKSLIETYIDDDEFLNNIQIISEKEEIKKNKNIIYTFYDINIEGSVICLKRDLLLKNLSIFFNDIYFQNKYFKLLYLSFNELYYKKFNNNRTVYNNELHLPFPSRIKNFSNSNLFIPKIFLSHDPKYFGSETFDIGHFYFKCIKLKKLTPTISHYLPKNNKTGLLFYDNNIYYPNTIILNIDCELINNKYTIFGTLKLTDKYLLFETQNDYEKYKNSIDYIFGTGEQELTKKEKQIIIKYQNIEEIIKRRFLFMYQAIEIFLLDGKSYFFNLFQIKKTENFFFEIQIIKKDNNLNFKIIDKPIQEFEKMKIRKRWYKRQIDTFQFLLYINKYSSRTFNDTNQYPIFPWIIKGKFILQNEEFFPNFREFSFPISIQENEQRFNAEKTFINSKDDYPIPFHFRLHYSNGAYVLLYLSRLSPFTEAQIKLQNNKFDSPDRQFSSFDELVEILLKNNDNRELIPDLFYTSEYFYNLNYNYFGIRSGDKQIINNLIIPYSFNNPAEYVYYMRYLLNSKDVRFKIDKWIDNVFGIYQFSEKPDKDRYNTFNPFSYGQNCKFLDIINNEQLQEREKKNMILDQKISILLFGQTPDILFKNKAAYTHQETAEEKKTDELSTISNLKKEFLIIKDKDKENIIIIYFWISYLNDKEFFYFLTKNNKKYEIIILEHTNDIKLLSKIEIDRIKLFRKLVFSKNKNKKKIEEKVFKLNPKYILFDIIISKNYYFFVGRNDDNSLMVYSYPQTLNFPKKIQTHSLITTLYKINETNFISGHFDGKIIEWIILDTNMNLKIKRDLFAHNNSMICSINYIQKHNILVTSSKDGILYVRKYFDFELLTIIKLGINEYANDIIFSNYDMYYLLIFNENNMTFNFNIYSINGLKVKENKLKFIIENFFSINNGKIIYTIYNDEHFYYYCLFDDKIKRYNIKQNPNFEDENYKINKFFYNEEKKIFYILLSNNTIYRLQDDDLTTKLEEIKRKNKNK